jgi:hypothetical protein
MAVDPTGGAATATTGDLGGTSDTFAQAKAMSDQLTQQQLELTMLTTKERLDRGPVERLKQSAQDSKLT